MVTACGILPHFYDVLLCKLLGLKSNCGAGVRGHSPRMCGLALTKDWSRSAGLPAATGIPSETGALPAPL